MDEKPDGRQEEMDLGGEKACWLDEVCSSCGAIGKHRPGCEFSDTDDDMVTAEKSPH